MSVIRVTHGIDDLVKDMTAITARVRPEMRQVVRECVDEGTKIARANARRSAGAHGKHYHRAITGQMHRGLGLFGSTISGEYGPDVNRRQGGMSFERGSRNQPPHNDLARSADIIGAKFELKVGLRVNAWFW